MRPATFYYLAQVWPPHGDRPLQSDARAAKRRRRAPAHARPRSRPRRELPAVARRVFAALSGTSPAA